MEKKEPPPSPSPAEGLTRREFLVNFFVGLGAFLGLGSLGVRFFQFLYPVIPPVRLVEVPLSKLSEVPEGAVRFFNLPRGRVLVTNMDNRLQAFSPVCTHLGCLVHWEADIKRIVCPCHKGVFDTDGKVVSGPPPRPLESIPLVTRGENLFAVLKVQEAEG